MEVPFLNLITTLKFNRAKVLVYILKLKPFIQKASSAFSIYITYNKRLQCFFVCYYAGNPLSIDALNFHIGVSINVWTHVS